MLILALRTDKPEAEIGLYNDDQELSRDTWQAHRQLAETIHEKIHQLLNKHSKDWSDLRGIAAYQGPGSFTGLRIGLSVANALAQSLNIPVAGRAGDKWLPKGIKQLQAGKGIKLVIPEYGSDVYTTRPRK